ncbi:PEGA domain-containing protein [Patescibacteria group bacterium]|nr:PEGA domain-containing protein [Patescibacteria group bacterium]MBU1931131.1 PEGA domain-containing protein [Patescibacteria group bacterium]
MKQKILLLAVFLVIALGLTGCSLPFGKKSLAALQVTTTPQATVFIDGEHRGTTPFFNEELKPGEYTLKLVPESGEVLLSPWESRVSLSKSVLTVVNRTFGASEDESAGEMLTLEATSNKKQAEIVLVSRPDGAVVSLDGEPRGFAPMNLSDITEGDHFIIVSLPGYQEREIKAKTIMGYRLVISVQLGIEPVPEMAEDGEATPSAEEATPSAKTTITITPSPTPKTSAEITDELERPFVEIDSPDIGWVRVRKNPCIADGDPECEEIAKANHGERYQLLDTDEAGWYQIQYDISTQGWISGRYAEKYE